MSHIQSLSLLLLLLVSYVSTCVEAEEIIACPAGWVSGNGKFPGCKACPLGTYQNRPSRRLCKKCPPNTSTNETAAVSKGQCDTVTTASDKVKPCEPGTYSTTGYAPCKPCDIGYYSTNTTTCKKCPSRRTTASTGATHRRNCTKAKQLVSCPQGSISPIGYQPCSKCPIGYYQPYQGQRVCAKCPEGLSNEAEGATNCTNLTKVEEQENNETSICTEVKYKKLKGVKLTRLSEEMGFFSSTNFPDTYKLDTRQQWKVHCFDSEYVGIIITHMSLSEGDYLQVKDDQCSGVIVRPTSRIIRKSSAGVIFSGVNGNNTGFQCAFLCIADYKRAWAESILYNEEIMEIIKPVQVNDTTGVEKAIDLILKYPFSILPGMNGDPYQRKILEITFGNVNIQ